MKKKKQKQSIPATDYSGGEMKSIIQLNSEFFDHLIELIPARFYIPTDEVESKPWFQGLKMAAKASLKQKTRENLKLARRHRFDPNGEPSSTLQLHQQQQITKEASGVAGELEYGESTENPIDGEGNEEKSVTYEELRERLRRKIELLRGNRSEKRSYERKVKIEGKKRKKGGEDDGEESEKGVSLDEDDDGVIIEYGKVKLGDEDEGKHVKSKKRKLSKMKELEIAKKKVEVKKENPSTAVCVSWKAATSKAMGIKVHDDPRLIKRSMKREKRKKEKNSEKWKERVETREKMKDERQKKRKENIVGRVNDKKQRRIAKREKKLMRPGFEGRKEGYITKE